MAQKRKKRTSTAKKTTASRKRSANSIKKITQKRRAQINQRWAFLLFFLALLTFLSMFRVDAVFVEFIGEISCKAVGIGFFALPFSFLLAGGLLIISRGRPIKWRVLCALLIPYMIGAVSHAFIGTTELDFNSMARSGELLRGGGVLAGYPVALLVRGISRIATIILFVMATVFVILTAFNLTVINAYDALRDFLKGMRREVEYDDEYYEEETVEKEPEIRLPRRRRPLIDIPLDDIKEAQPEPEPEMPGLALAPTAVKTPAEVLAGEETVHINEDNFSDDVLRAIEEGTKNAAEGTPDAGFVIPEPEKLENKTMYAYPPLSLLDAPKASAKISAVDELKTVGIKLGETIKSFGIDTRVVNIVRGPSVTRYEVQLDAGVKLSKLTALSEDIALALGASGVFIAPIPNKSLIGIEVPNKTVQVVNMSEVIASDEFTKNESNVAFALGKDISGNCMVCDIAKLPHMLIAGTTGSGKSVCINSIIVSILYKATPEQVRLIMIDPKMVELGVYNGIPHLLVPVVTDPKKAAGALQWAVVEMMRRYKLFSERNVRDMKSYNKAVARTGDGEPLPQIVIVIDELSDLMVVARKDVEDSIMRLSQMARAAGMHLIIATQRPSVDVITGVIKSNIPSRIAFAVASKIESNIILGSMGAEKLIGRGDMLYEPMGVSKPTRVQGCFISSDEVEAVVAHVKSSSTAEYSEEIMEQIERNVEKSEGGAMGADGDDSDADEMLDAAIDVVMESGQASTSMLQRRLKLGYSRAARIIDQMEERGIVGEFEGSKPRKILITREQWQEIKMRREGL